MDEAQTGPTGPDLTKGIAVGAIADGGMLAGHVGDDAVLLARGGEEFFAVSAHCSHYGGPLADGLRAGDTVRCPWHHACFSLRSGEALHAPAFAPLSCWSTEVRQGRVFVYPKKEARSASRSARGPRADSPLAGKAIHVRKSSSYYESLLALNERFKTEGKPLVKLELVPDALEDEDMLEMLSAGLLQAMVVDDWKAKMWAQVLPKLVVHENIVLREPTRKGWAIRKGSPKLKAALTELYANEMRKTGVIPYRQKQYMARIKSLNNPTGADYQRFEQTIALFEKYGDKYKFDPLMLAAQGYQESKLDQSKRSRVGAIGVMQIMPATGRELGVGDITKLEANVNGGAKYMDQLLSKYFQDADFHDEDRTLFAFAAYNAGPGNIGKMRKEAEKRGLDPNKWFNNVEVVTAEKIGMEPTTYVRNIYKYYVSYKLTEDARAKAEALKQKVVPTKQ